MVIDKSLKCVKGSENSADIYFAFDKVFKDWYIKQVDLKDLKKNCCRRAYSFVFKNKLCQDVSFEVISFLGKVGGYFSNSPNFRSFLSLFSRYYNNFVLKGSKKNFYFSELCLDGELFVEPFKVLGKNRKIYFRAFFQDCLCENGVLYFKFINPVFVDEFGNLTDFSSCEEN